MARPPRANRRASAHVVQIGCVLFVVFLAGTSAAGESSGPAKGQVLLIRGIFNVFSTGIDRLADQLEHSGYEIEVTPPAGSFASAWRLRDRYRQNPASGPIVLIGHSMGGRACLHISRYLESYNIPVDLVVVADSNPWTSVPSNVRRCVNLYVTNPFGVFHGIPVRGAPGAQIVNVDVTKLRRPQGAGSVNHFNIDNSAWMQRIILAEIQRAGPMSTITARPVVYGQPSRAIPVASPPGMLERPRRRDRIELRL